MKSTYVGTRSANVGDIRCLFALASDSTTNLHNLFYNSSRKPPRNSMTSHFLICILLGKCLYFESHAR